mgnify:FL=1
MASNEYVVFMEIKENDSRQEYCTTFETEDEAQLFVDSRNRKVDKWGYEYYFEKLTWEEKDNNKEEMKHELCKEDYVINEKIKQMFKVIDPSLIGPYLVLQTRSGRSDFVANMNHYYRLETKGEIKKENIKNIFIK